MVKCSLTLIAAAVIAGCGDTKNNAPIAQNVSIQKLKEWQVASGSFVASDPDGQTVTISKISENGESITSSDGVYKLKNGILTVKGLDFKFLPLNGSDSSFTYTVTDGITTTNAQVTVTSIASDPLTYQQWHLRNTGQLAWSQNISGIKKFLIQDRSYTEEKANAWIAANVKANASIPGEDMNVLGAHSQGVTGAGVIAVVVDSGLEISHEDLEANVLPKRSLNMVTGATNINDPTNAETLGDHGTSVAGLIAAVGWNGLGGRGVAPDAKLIGMNWLYNQTARNQTLTYGAPGSGITNAENVVFNRSYGFSYPAMFEYDLFSEEMQRTSATTLRNGLGAINVKAAGNSYRSIRISSLGDTCTIAVEAGLTCQNGAFEPTQNTPYTITVGAVDADGSHTSYSTAGPSLFVAAPAGEYGDLAPAMVTTDQMSCLRGYASFAYVDAGGVPEFDKNVTPFVYPGHPENKDCNYTSTFNGTSSATPNVTGVVSLILSANPNLSYREVKDILVKTSTKNDPDNKPIYLSMTKDYTPKDILLYKEDFNNTDYKEYLPDWVILDSNADQNTWGVLQEYSGGMTPAGTQFLTSDSYSWTGNLNPDDWAISPEIDLIGLSNSKSVTLSWKERIGVLTPKENDENYSVYVVSGTSPDDLANAELVYTKRGGVEETVTVDLSPYTERVVRIAFRHHDIQPVHPAPSVASRIGIDDIRIEATGVVPAAAKQILATNQASQLSESEPTYMAHAGWVKNAAGYSFNNLFGFGRVNAGEAVKLAKNYTTKLPPEQVTDWISAGTMAGADSLNLKAPDMSNVGVEHEIYVAEDITVEAMQFKFDISNPELTDAGFSSAMGDKRRTTAGIDLALEVTSPSGTKSILLSSKQAIVDSMPNQDYSANPGYIMKGAVILSNAFYGERAKGTWKIKVIDANGNDYPIAGSMWPRGYKNNTELTTLEGWGVRVFGH